ncbi:nuclear transport factor 2 family protein [Amycolatopsis sp. DG1A-15b]|uniref:nuclear transport factor 2 family protein n=1 Tax=Amycolatopsis sp. DG1A-15b TaxID=3052846 RepID=UPI00255BFD75|nr:nuclear transport factor 2 family protein [Amycolatopsis sp. DG1A-15b]WIX91227.1 nuclear transport factor 2 family protein [Amycolatopsis sp. DG1A-15b]
MSVEEQVREFGRVWAAAEERGDTEVLAELVTDGFRLVGPLGFVLDRDQWLARYAGGGLVTEKLGWTEVEVREFGGTAIAIGVHEQVATHQGNPVNGRFRATHVLVHADDRWRLAGIHLSPIGVPFTPGGDRR